MNRSLRRSIRKKAIPLCFQKSHSNSQFLVTANYKHQIKKLKKTNKELACSLQDAKSRAADQERALAECTRENTQATFVKMKIKDIVETVKKLVTDLGEVYDVLDGKSFDFLKNCSVSHQEARLQICNPSVSTIEESGSMSTIEQDLSKENLSVENSTSPARFELPAFDANSSKTEIYNVPFALASDTNSLNVLNGNQGPVTRSSKPLEPTDSLSLDSDSPSTPEPPVLNPNLQLSIESRSLVDVSNLKPVTSQALVTSQRSVLKSQPVTSTSTAKSTPKSSISKIPIKKLAASNENNSTRLAVSPSHINRRKTFVVDSEKPQQDTVVLNSFPANAKLNIISDKRGTFVINSLADNAKSDIVSDRRGTFVVNSLADNVESDIVSDRRGTFAMNSLTVDTNPDALWSDHRATYFIPTLPKEQHDTSPKVTQAGLPVQNAAPNQTILLCEDMELTEILPFQNQSQQFTPSWNEKKETTEPELNQKLSASVINQHSCSTTFIKQFPVSNINSSGQFQIRATNGFVKDAQMQNMVNIKKDNDKKSVAPNILSKIKSWAETSAPNQVMNSTDPQQKKVKETDVEANMHKKEDMNTNIENCAKKPPSPIAHYAKHNMSVQNKIFESFSAVSTVSDKSEPTSDCTLVAKEDNKKSTASKDSLSVNQPAVENVTVTKESESPVPGKRSSRKQTKCYATFFSESEESDIEINKYFEPDKRFSLKPGRKIINPNNNKVFVFKKKSKKLSTNKDTSDSSPDKQVDEDIKNDLENDIFNFSASSEADKSPLTKTKKRKSVMPKNNKCSVKKQSGVSKRLSKTTSKRSSKSKVNEDDVPVVALPRKSILCLNKGNSPVPLRPSLQFSRKSVRFSLIGTALQDEKNNHKCDSPDEINLNPVSQKSDGTNDSEEVSSRNTRGSLGKKSCTKKRYSSARPNSLTATGDILKSSKSKRSRKCQSNSLNSVSFADLSESGCSQKKKMVQISNEIPIQKNEAHTNLNCEKQKQSKNVENRFESFQGTSDAISSDVLVTKSDDREKRNCGLPNMDANVKVDETDVNKVKQLSSVSLERRSNKRQSAMKDIFPSEAHEEKTIDGVKEKKSSGILSELPQNLDGNVIVAGSTDKAEGKINKKVKRTFSGVSERRSNKKQSLVDELYPSLDEVICEIVDENIDRALKLIEDEPTEVYNIKEIAECIETDCKKGNTLTKKTSKQKKSSKAKKTSPSHDEAICEMVDENMDRALKLIEDEPAEVYNVKEIAECIETDCKKGNTLTKKTSKQKKSSKGKKTLSKQYKDKENTPHNAENKFKLDVLTSDDNLCALLDSKEYTEKTLKPKNSRKKKESILLPQNDVKFEAHTSENNIGSNEAIGGQGRRKRVTSYKEPSLNRKMRRE